MAPTRLQNKLPPCSPTQGDSGRLNSDGSGCKTCSAHLHQDCCEFTQMRVQAGCLGPARLVPSTFSSAPKQLPARSSSSLSSLKTVWTGEDKPGVPAVF